MIVQRDVQEATMRKTGPNDAMIDRVSAYLCSARHKRKEERGGMEDSG